MRAVAGPIGRNKNPLPGAADAVALAIFDIVFLLPPLPPELFIGFIRTLPRGSSARLIAL
jgi:hypothetical protein